MAEDNLLKEKMWAEKFSRRLAAVEVTPGVLLALFMFTAAASKGSD